MEYYCYRKFTCPKKVKCHGRNGITITLFDNVSNFYCKYFGKNVRAVTGFEYTMLETIYSTEGFVSEIMKGSDEKC
jgi:hypothetical protein